jgi:hypothetical protein
MDDSTPQPEFIDQPRPSFYEAALGKDLSEEETGSLPYGPDMLKVDNIDEAVSRIKQHYPNAEELSPKYSLIPGENQIVIQDPSGHMLVLIEEQKP